MLRADDGPADARPRDGRGRERDGPDLRATG